MRRFNFFTAEFRYIHLGMVFIPRTYQIHFKPAVHVLCIAMHLL